jgi:hypothetical protein
MCPKIDVMERECKNLEFGSDLNGAWVFSSLFLYVIVFWVLWNVRNKRGDSGCLSAGAG